MNGSRGVQIHNATAVAVPAAFALPALETIFKEFAQHPGSASLALNVQQLHVPFEALISVPVEAHIAAGNGRNEWHIAIRAASKPQFYPTFEGTLTLLSADRSGSQLQLEGRYVVPFGALGRAGDLTLLRGVAEEALRRFLREVAARIAALSRWASYA